jgi:hypothetical protein
LVIRASENLAEDLLRNQWPKKRTTPGSNAGARTTADPALSGVSDAGTPPASLVIEYA